MIRKASVVQYWVGALFFLTFPLLTNAQVTLSEIAWMGTVEDVNNEWIELHNQGGDAVSVDGWTIDDGNALVISLVGEIPAGAMVLLERTDDLSVPDVPAFMTYTGALGNDGRTLTVKNAGGGTEDQAVGGTDWTNLGGNNVTKETAQRTGTGWVTGAPTPGATNVAYNSSTNNDTANSPDTDTDEEETSSTKESAGSSGGGSSRKVKEIIAVLPGVLSLTVNAPKTVYVNQKVDFEAVPYGVGPTIINSLTYAWNFGDTYVGEGKKISHVFAYPGEYVVVAHATFAKHSALMRHDITVLPTSFELTRSESGDIILHNKSKYEVDMGGYTLRGESNFIFPHFTFVKANGAITIPKDRIGTRVMPVALLDTEREYVAQLGYSNATPSAPVVLAQYERPKPTPVVLGATATQATKNEVAEEITTREPAETMIRIGEVREEKKQGGVVTQLFRKIAGIFGW